MKNVTMNNCIEVFVWTCILIFLWYISREKEQKKYFRKVMAKNSPNMRMQTKKEQKAFHSPSRSIYKD